MEPDLVQRPVPCFTRTERNGIRVIFPLEGQMKQNCLLVNETVELETIPLMAKRAAVLLYRLSRGEARS